MQRLPRGSGLKAVFFCFAVAIGACDCGGGGDDTTIPDAGPSGDATVADGFVPECEVDADCDDGAFCNGAEACSEGLCVDGTEPCLAGMTCDEDMDACLTECDIDPDADDDGANAIMCGGDDCDDADPMSFPGGTELCDAVDNDCDLTTDEGFMLGESCEGAGECGAGITECSADGGVQCSTEAGGSADESGAEICDGLDNDCDGTVDEGFDVGAACEGEGVCGTGLVECNAEGAAQCSTEPGGSADESAAERCDDMDWDCDGATEPTTLGDACDGAGECGAGTVECDGSGTVICSTEPGGSADETATELCDGLDNDCDGAVDNGFAVGDTCDGAGACGMGLVECASTTTTRCSTDPGGSDHTPGSESCDGVDNDCDGTVDEGFALGGACDGVGVCGAGVFECDAAGTGTQCSTDIGGSAYGGASESCNGADEDCDGIVDEDFTLGGACDGVGECGVGVVECDVAGTGTQCSTDVGGSADGSVPELCNGLDDDCNGVDDNGFGLGLSCDGAGACGSGVTECNASGSATQCSTEPGGSVDESVPESCNAIDDDCNGTVDDGFGIGNTCVGVGVCGTGVLECDSTGSASQCSTDIGGSGYGGGTESCNGLDDDCDGSSDETYALGGACDGVGACGIGTVECTASGAGTQCSTDLGGSGYDGSTELCNGIDDDCDGSTDEGFAIGGACDGVGACGAGLLECDAAGTGVQCSTDIGGSAYGGATETCNGVDDDCDGTTDNGFAIGGACDGVGECGVGTVECDAGGTGVVCSTDIGGSAYGGVAEACNGLDDDCDGSADEDSVTAMCGTAANATYACNGVAGCAYTCDGSYLDPNGSAADGCECLPDAESVPMCASATLLATLTDSDETRVIDGNLDFPTDEDWYQVAFTNGAAAGYKIQAYFSVSAPGIVFDIENGGCPGTGANECTIATNHTFDPREESAQCTPISTSGTQCNSAAGRTYWIRVYRTSGTDTCTPYQLTLTNGVDFVTP
ncbi:MAG: hypothetical protein JJ863_22445 [Deltaproteobacteria bacterium]|nr:hypothetical protein [Deltaproteobacteria bacterium]